MKDFLNFFQSPWNNVRKFWSVQIILKTAYKAILKCLLRCWCFWRVQFFLLLNFRRRWSRWTLKIGKMFVDLDHGKRNSMFLERLHHRTFCLSLSDCAVAYNYVPIIGDHSFFCGSWNFELNHAFRGICPVWWNSYVSLDFCASAEFSIIQ